MGFWDFLKEEPKVEKLVEERAFERKNLLISGMSNTTSGKFTEEQVMSIPIAKACRDKICGAIKTLPVELFQTYENEDGIECSNIVKEDYRLDILNNRPNLTSTASTLKEKIVNDVILHGNAYIAVEKQGNKVVELWALNPEEVSPVFYKDDVKRFITKNVKYNVLGCQKPLEYDEVMVIAINSTDGGITGKGVIEMGEKTIELALNEMATINAIMENGMAPSGILSADTALSDKAISNLQKSLKDKHIGAKNKGSLLILEGGMKYQKMSLTPTELGVSEVKSQNNSDICKLFGVPEEIAGGKTLIQSVEPVNIFFLQYCASTVIKVIEEAFNQYLLTEKEKAEGYFFKINTDDILQTTIKERYEALQAGLNAGILTMNEARAKEKLAPLSKDVDFFKYSLGNIFYYPESNRYFIANTGVQFNPVTGEIVSSDGTLGMGAGGEESSEMKKDETLNKDETDIKNEKDIKDKEDKKEELVTNE